MEGNFMSDTTHGEMFSGSGSFRLIDMENAGKRGKTCKVLRFNGYPWDLEHSKTATEPQKAAARWSRAIYYRVFDLAGVDCTYQHDLSIPLSLSDVAGHVNDMVHRAAIEIGNGTELVVYEDSIKGVDAPVEPLGAGVPGKWSAQATNRGISMRQLDDVNEWSEITHGQTGNAAYRIARKVWDQVMKCATLREAREILESAGARLHGYCALD